MTGAELGLTAAFALAAFLYATVGHAGASGYLAAMALAGMPVAVMRPVALVLNLVVGSIALVQFSRAGCFSWRLFWPFVLGAAPCAMLGGALNVPGTLYRLLVAIGLVLAAFRLARPLPAQAEVALRPPSWRLMVPVGAVIGLVAGLTGTGGGIYLSPLIIFCRWGEPRETAGVAAAFILVNSLAGLLGHRPELATLPAALPLWGLVVAGAGFAGAWFGSRRSSPTLFKRLLAAVLLIAAIKLLLT